MKAKISAKKKPRVPNDGVSRRVVVMEFSHNFVNAGVGPEPQKYSPGPANFQPTAVTDATSRPLAHVEHRTNRGE
jgi:hypothetical protein